jgi:hypothetical protein
MKAIVGAEILDQDRFAAWLPVLQEWGACHVEFAQQVDDAAYWYTERSNVGILAQAAWRSGRVALEEYQARKSRQHGHATKEWLGRCDLWISDEQGGELIEAKQEYLALRSRQAVFWPIKYWQQQSKMQDIRVMAMIQRPVASHFYRSIYGQAVRRQLSDLRRIFLR